MKPSFTQTLSSLAGKSPSELNALGMRIGQALNYAAAPGSASAFGSSGGMPQTPQPGQSAFDPAQIQAQGVPMSNIATIMAQMQGQGVPMGTLVGQTGQLESAAQNAISMRPTGAVPPLNNLPQWNPGDFQGLPQHFQGLPQLGGMKPAGQGLQAGGMSLFNYLKQPQQQKNPAGTVMR